MRLTVASKPVEDWDRRKRNIAAAKAYPRFKPQGDVMGPVAICAAGPSLLKTLPILKAFYNAGIPICAVKGVASLLLEHGIIPKYAVFLDARPDQIRMVQTTHKDTIYCLGSTVDPSVYEKLKADGCDIRVFNAAELKLFVDDDTDYVTGGSTTGLRAINLMRWAGYTKPLIFGYDCCLTGDVSHVYSKTNPSPPFKCTISDREFTTTPELACQYQEFLEHYVAVDEPLDITVYGDGALAWAIRRIAQGFSDIWMDIPQTLENAVMLINPAQIAEFRPVERIVVTEKGAYIDLSSVLPA